MSETRSIIATSGAPAAIGPYSQAVRAGNLLFTSGQIPLDPETQQIVAGDITVQAERVLQNLQAVLEAAGTGFAHVAKATVFLKNFDDFAALNAVYAKYLTDAARTTVEVARLPKDVLVEIDLVAVIP